MAGCAPEIQQCNRRRLINYPVLPIFVVLSTIILHLLSRVCKPVALLRDRSRIPSELGENRAAATKRSMPRRGGQPLLCPTSKRLLVTPHSFAFEIEMLYERRLAVIFRSSVASIKLRFSSRE